MKQISHTTYSNWKYRKIKAEINKLVGEGIIKQTYPLEELNWIEDIEDKFDREIYIGPSSTLHISHEIGSYQKDGHKEVSLMTFGKTKDAKLLESLIIGGKK